MSSSSNIIRRVVAIILPLFLLVFQPVKSFADELADVLGGFDESTENQELSDIMGGFENDSTESFDEVVSESVSPLYLSGSVGVAGAFDLNSHKRTPYINDRHGLSKLRSELDLTADLDLGNSWKARVAGQGFYDLAYTIRGRDNYTSQALDEYEDEIELGEAWLQGTPLPGLDLKVGRQIVVWGKSDNIRVADVLNPMDKREPGMTDIEDLRLPVTMSKVDYSIDNWTMTGIVVHEIRFNKLPAYGSDYYTSTSTLPDEEVPNDFNLDNQELAMAVNGEFGSGGVSFYAANVFDDSAHVETEADGTYKRVHSKINMVGMAANVVDGNWLYKAEGALLDGLEYYALPSEEKTRLDALIGVEYYGFTDTTISLEAVNRHIFGFDNSMKGSPDSAIENDFQWALRISRDFMHERLDVSLLTLIYDVWGQGGAMGRLECSYELSDSWEATAGIVLYHPRDRANLENLDECNRLFFKLKYSF